MQLKLEISNLHQVLTYMIYSKGIQVAFWITKLTCMSTSRSDICVFNSCTFHYISLFSTILYARCWDFQHRCNWTHCVLIMKISEVKSNIGRKLQIKLEKSLFVPFLSPHHWPLKNQKSTRNRVQFYNQSLSFTESLILILIYRADISFSLSFLFHFALDFPFLCLFHLLGFF